MIGSVQFGRWLLASLILLGLTGITPSRASSVEEVGLGEMAAASELVFEGQAISVDSRWSEDGSSIRTYVTFRVLDVIKGTAGRTVTLGFSGGTVGSLRLSVSDLNMPVPGEKGVYFVENTGRDQINPLYGWSQGQFLLVRDPSGKGERVLTADARPVMALDNSGNQSKAAALSSGVARGVVTGDQSRVANALSADAFIQRLRELVFAGA